MLLLAGGKHITGWQLGNPVLMTEARVTLVDAYLAAAVFVGVGLNSGLGWWWADPLSGATVPVVWTAGQLPGRNKLKAGSRRVGSSFPKLN
jgi:divalent metal cation (Fe/Co/Zn/Cd) transporter